MNKIDTYREVLKTLKDWEPYILQESGLPGPRGILLLPPGQVLEGFESGRSPPNTPYLLPHHGDSQRTKKTLG